MFQIQTYRVCLRLASKARRVSRRDEAQAVLAAILNGLDADQEHLVVLGLDTGGRVIGYKVVASGTDCMVPADPKRVFRAALALGAHSIIIGHNHPSGRTEESEADKLARWQLVAAGQLVGVKVQDNIIL